MYEYEVERRLIGIGQSLAVVLPIVWIKARKLTKGQKVLVAFDSHDYLKIKIKEDTSKPTGTVVIARTRPVQQPKERKDDRGLRTER